MKSFQRPQFALADRSEGKIYHQLSSAEILLLKSSLSSQEISEFIVFDPALRKWLPLDSAIEFKDVDFKFDRNIKAPPINLPNSAKDPAQSQSLAGPGTKTPQAPSPPVVPAPPSMALKPASRPEPIRSIPEPKEDSRLIADEKTEIVEEDHSYTEEISAPSPKLQKIKDPIHIPTAGVDLDNPFSNLKRAFNREKLNPDVASLDKNPLIKTEGPLRAPPPSRGKNKDKKWVDLSSRKILLSFVSHVAFEAYITYVCYPEIALSASLIEKQGSILKATARYANQNYILDLVVNQNAEQSHILEIRETSDYRFFKDLLIVMGAC